MPWVRGSVDEGSAHADPAVRDDLAYTLEADGEEGAVAVGDPEAVASGAEQTPGLGHVDGAFERRGQLLAPDAGAGGRGLAEELDALGEGDDL